MKVLITTGIFKPELGGPATYSAELAKRLHAAGHPVKVITYSDKSHFDPDTEFPYPIVRVVRSKKKIINYIKYFFAVLREARKYDFIYTLDWFSVGVPLCAASFVMGKKYVVRIGGGYIWEKYLAQGRPPLTLKAFYEKKIYQEYKSMYLPIKIVLRRAAHVVFNSDEQRILYQKYYGLKPERISTIYNPVPEHRLGALMQSYHDSNAARDKEIVFAGRFIKMKNVESLVHAFAKLNDSSFRLLLIGEGPTEAELRKIVADLNLTDRVEFMKPLPAQDLYRRIANCYYFALPSWTDVSPNQIYECLAVGIPFLLTKENYLSINKFNFLKIDPNSVADIEEKMNWLLVEENYQKFVKSLSEIRFEYSWKDVVVDHMKLFTKLFPRI